MDVVNHVIELTKLHNWSKYRLSLEADLPLTTIANIYYRGSTPSIYTLERICKAFNMTLSEFFTDDKTSATLLTEENLRLVSYYRALNSSQQQQILKLMQEMGENQNAADETSKDQTSAKAD
jgi:transcriptional regulator with XRE-family HTH domain